MAELQKEAKHHLNKTTNTIILDYLLWLASKTILEEAAAAAATASVDKGSTKSGHRSKGRRLVGLVDGLIMTFDLKDRPKFSYSLLTRRIELASLVIVFVYRDSRSQYITRRSSESQTSPTRLEALKARTARFLGDRGIKCVVHSATQTNLHSLRVSSKTKSLARTLFEVDEIDTGRISLRDALHRFFLVSASCYATQTPGALWISIALNFCLFAALEGYLLSGEVGVDCLNECFSYGILARPNYGQVEIDRLFTEKGADFSRTWETERQSTLDKFVVSGKGDMESHLLRLLHSHDFSSFRESVTTYLSAILESMDDPELSKYPSALDKSILRAPGMISIAHESDAVVTDRKRKRPKVAA